MSQQAGTVHISTNELQSQSHVGCRATHSLDRFVDFQPVLSAFDYCHSQPYNEAVYRKESMAYSHFIF